MEGTQESVMQAHMTWKCRRRCLCVCKKGNLIVEAVAAPVGSAVIWQGDPGGHGVQAALHQVTEHTQISACQLIASKEEITGERGTLVSKHTHTHTHKVL